MKGDLSEVFVCQQVTYNASYFANMESSLNLVDFLRFSEGGLLNLFLLIIAKVYDGHSRRKVTFFTSKVKKVGKKFGILI